MCQYGRCARVKKRGGRKGGRKGGRGERVEKGEGRELMRERGGN